MAPTLTARDMGRALSRRHVLGLAALLPGLTLRGCDESLVTGRVLAPAPVALHSRWAGRPDGPMPAVGDEGRPMWFLANHPTAPSVDDGALVGGLPASASATYVEQDLTRKVARIGAVFGYEPGADTGSIALIALVRGGRLDGHGHIAVSPAGWVAATVQDGSLVEYASGRFTEPLVQDGRPYRTEVRFDGDTAEVDLPDGTIARARHPAIGTKDGAIAGWEFFRSAPDGAPVRMYETWAG